MGMSATYPERYAEALGLDMGAAETDAVLDLARVVAHGSERRFAPLSSYLAGQFVAGRMRSGVPHSEALAEAVAIAEGVLEGEGDRT
jgi:hypothetical protein